MANREFMLSSANRRERKAVEAKRFLLAESYWLNHTERLVRRLKAIRERDRGFGREGVNNV